MKNYRLFVGLLCCVLAYGYLPGIIANDQKLQRAVWNAIEKDNLAEFKRLEKEGAVLTGYNQGSPLQQAIYHDSRKIFRYLLSKGISLPTDAKAQSNLLFQVRSDEVALTLIKKGIRLDLKKYDGSTFLRHMAEYALVKTAQYAFLKQSYELNEKDKYGHDIISLACGPIYIGKKSKIGIKNMVAFLLSKGANANVNDDNPDVPSPLLACYHGGAPVSTLELLIKHGANPNTSGFFGTTIFADVGPGRKYRQMRKLMKKYKGIKYIHPRENSDLFNAVIRKNYSKVKATDARQFEKIQGRTSDGIPVTPVHMAVINHDSKILDILSDKKVNWNVRDAYGSTPLYWAVLDGKEDLVKKLLDYGADPNVHETTNHNILSFIIISPLDYAVSRNKEITQVLIDGGAKLFRKEYHRLNSVLEHAVMSGRKETVVKLIKLETSAGNIGKYNYSLVNSAAKYGYVDILNILFKAGLPLRGSRQKYLKEAKAQRDRVKKYKENIRKYTRQIIQTSKSRRTGLYKMRFKSGYPNFPGVFASDPVKKFPSVSRQSVDIYVPTNYTGDKKFGLLVFMANGKPGSSYRKFLDKHNIIWAGFNAYSASRRGVDQGYLAIAAAYHLQKKYNIDSNRVYVGGFSWGGLISANLLGYYPFLFKGMISMARGIKPSSSFAKRLPIVMTTGDLDSNLAANYMAYRLMMLNGYKHIKYIQEPGKGHTILSGLNFEKAILFLDKHRPRI
ncbi:ankyrin repeat domain-containing protein [Spirochaetota bacterium]